MKRIFRTMIWPLGIAALVVACVRFLHPATFSQYALPTLILSTVVCAALAIHNQRYE